MSLPRKTAVTVIGGGFAGLSAAIECARRGLGVILLESGTMGSGASGKNAGHLCHGFIPTDRAMTAKLGGQLTASLWRMSREGVDTVKQRAADYHRLYGIDCGLHMGYLVAARTPGQLPKIRDHYRHLRQRYGYDKAIEIVPQDMQRYLQSSLRHGGIYDSAMGQLEPHAYLAGLRREAEGLKIEIVENAEVVAVKSGAPCTLTYRQNGEQRQLDCNDVICSGYKPATLIADARRKIIRLQTFVGKTAPLTQDLREAIFPVARTVADYSNLLTYFRCTGDNRIIIGSGDCVSNTSEKSAMQRLRQTPMRLFPDLGATPFEQIWQGTVDFTASQLPHLARYDNHIYTLQGYSGLGLAMTAITARTAAEAITGQPERFARFAAIPHRDVPQQPLIQAAATHASLLRYRMLDWMESMHGLRKAA